MSPFSRYLEAQVLPILWSRKPSPGPLLSNVLKVGLIDDSFHGLAIYPRLVIGPNVTEIRIKVLSNAFSWANATAVLGKASLLSLSRFDLLVTEKSSYPKEAELLELLPTLCGVRELSFGDLAFLTSRAISIISTFPRLEDLQLSITEQEVEKCVPHMVNNFPAITHLDLSSKTMNACRLMLLQLQSGTLRSLSLTQTTSNAPWSMRSLLVILHECNLVTLESLYVHDCPGPTSEKFFSMDAYTFECLRSFKQLHDLHLESSFVDLDNNDLMGLAKSLPQLHSLLFLEAGDPDYVPKCTFTGMQYLIQFCPKLERLMLPVDARQIPILAAQPDGEYPSGLHLTTLDLYNVPILNADDVASYLTMLFPVLADFSTIYYQEGDEEEDADPYRMIWLKVEELMGRFIP